MPFIPHTEHETQEMLAAIGVDSVQALFAEIPAALQLKEPLKIPDGLTEMQMARLLEEKNQRNFFGLNFIGAGAYEHHIPAAVWDIVSRGEFMTAYTPYQAEASQGTLQLIYEFQTMMASLAGMDVANASLYDGSSALAEAILMAVRAHKQAKSRRIVVPMNLHPFYRQVIATTVRNQNIELLEVGFDSKTGTVDFNDLEKLANNELTAIVIPQPNFFGVLEDVDRLTDWGHGRGMLVIACVNPTSLALLKEPGSWGTRGADIVCGEGQPLGVPLASGGPYFGFMTCRKEFVRQMPGRIVGRTTDMDGKTGFALTLQAREQHIRRSKATSNICTNQGLLVTAATIYMSLLGPEGLRRVAVNSHAQTKKLVELLTTIPGVERIFSGAFFHEVILRLPRAVNEVIAQLAERGVLAGYDVSSHYPELGNAMLVCATETKTDEDLQKYYQLLKEILM